VTEDITAQLSDAARELLSRRLSGRETAPGSSIGAYRGERPPLSFGQRRLWFIDRLTTAKFAYNTPLAFRIRGRLDRDVLERSLGHVVDRHEALRTHYGIAEGEPFQVIEPSLALGLTETDLSETAHPETAAVEMIERDAEAEFDLGTAALFRFRLIRLADNDHVLVFVVHHTVFDRASLEIWLREVGQAFAALSAGREPNLPELPVRYADFAAWQQREMDEGRFDTHLDHWRAELADAPAAVELPYDRPRPPQPSHQAGFVDFELGSEVLAKLRDVAARYGTTLFVVGLAAYQVVLARYAGSGQVIVGCPADGRTKVALEPLIGFFVNSLPIRADLSGDPAFPDVLARAKSAMLAAHAHQDVPFDRIVEAVGVPPDLSRNPLFQVWFDLVSHAQGGESGRLDLTGLVVTPFDTGRVRTRFDIELHLTETADARLLGRLIYATDLFDHDTISRFARHCANVLESVAERPDQRMSEVRMFTTEELHTILHVWGAGSGWR
jgi:hypothetical protein